jgi:hypothetical protein
VLAILSTCASSLRAFRDTGGVVGGPRECRRGLMGALGARCAVSRRDAKAYLGNVLVHCDIEDAEKSDGGSVALLERV